jgi:hypothetical protein
LSRTAETPWSAMKIALGRRGDFDIRRRQVLAM